MTPSSRCEVHGTARAPDGTCILCLRRSGTGARSAGPLGWIVALVVGGLVTSAVAFRLHLATADRHPANAAVTAQPEPEPSAPPTAAATTTTAMPVAAAGATGEPTVDRDRLVAEAARSVQIDLYGEGWCPSCRKARAWLDREGIAYTYRDTSDDVNKHTMRALNPNSTIPTISIEGQVVVGFNPGAMRSAIQSAAEARVAKRAR